MRVGKKLVVLASELVINDQMVTSQEYCFVWKIFKFHKFHIYTVISPANLTFPVKASTVMFIRSVHTKAAIKYYVDMIYNEAHYVQMVDLNTVRRFAKFFTEKCSLLQLSNTLPHVNF